MSSATDLDFLNNEIERLNGELKEKDKNLILSAQYGQDLLETKSDLLKKFDKTVREYEDKAEIFKQEKHSLTMKLEGTEGLVSSISAELERVENQHKKATQNLTSQKEEELSNLHRKISSRENTIEAQQIEISECKKESERLKTLLEEFRQREEMACDNKSESILNNSLEYQQQICDLTEKIQDYEKAVSNLKSHLKDSALALKKVEAELERTKEELEVAECKLTSATNEVQRVKSEKEELKMEIDVMKLEETDPNKKGNSLFAELEDNRQAVMKKYLTTIAKLDAAKKQSEMKSEEISKLKIHVSSLLRISNNEADLLFQRNLDTSLSIYKNQVDSLTSRCRELEDQLKDRTNSPCRNEQKPSNYVESLYKDSQTEVLRLQKELRERCFKNVSLHDQVLQLTRQLRQCKRELEVNKSEMIRMQAMLESSIPLKGVSEEDYASPIHDDVPNGRISSPKNIKSNQNDVGHSSKKLKIDKENTSPCFEGTRDHPNQRKMGKFSELETEVEACDEKKKRSESEEKCATKRTRRTMEAPHIKFTNDAESSEECKVQ